MTNRNYLILAAVAVAFIIAMAALSFAFASATLPPANRNDNTEPGEILTSGTDKPTPESTQDTSDPGTSRPETSGGPEGTEEPPPIGGGDVHGAFTVTGNYTPSEKTADALESAINKFGRPTGLMAVDIATGMTITHGENDALAPASVVKVVYALYCFRRIDAGDAKFDEILTYTAEDRVNGNGVIGRAGIGAQFTLYDVLYHTINTSDNEGYYMLMRRFGRIGCDEMTSALGCTTCKFASSRWPRVSARDLAVIWAEIYKYRSETDCGSIFYDMLLNVSRMHFFRDATGHGTANKSGWNESACNESGIVYGDRTYILVLLTEGSYYTANMDAYGDIVRAVDAMMSEYNSSMS